MLADDLYSFLGTAMTDAIHPAEIPLLVAGPATVSSFGVSFMWNLRVDPISVGYRAYELSINSRHALTSNTLRIMLGPG